MGMETIVNELTGEQERLIVQFQDFATRVGIKTFNSLPRGPVFTMEDAVQEACQGLVQAAVRFDQSKHDPTIADIDTNFKSFAYPRIRGAVIDAARKTSFVRRRGIEKGIDLKVVSFDGLTETGEDQIGWQFADIESDLDLVIDFQAALKTLSERERFVVLSIGSGASGKEVADELGVTESRVSQIVGEAKNKLHLRMAA